MLTKSEFKCPVCGLERKQRIVFLGSEFSYECLECLSVHCFVENLYWDFTDNFRTHGCSNPWSLSRYIGTMDRRGIWHLGTHASHSFMPKNGDPIVSGTSRLRDAFARLLESPHEGSSSVDIIKLSKKQPSGCFFVANAVPNQHFQECFRAVVRMKEHLVSEESGSSYNILIADRKMEVCLSPPSKMEGLDEVWKVDWSRIHSVWHVLEKPDELHDAVALGKSITRFLDNFDGEAKAISKRGGPCVRGTGIIKELLHSEDVEFTTSSGDIIQEKRIAVLVRKDRTGRAGFSSPNQIREVCDFVRDFGLKPILVSCSDEEDRICRNVDEPSLFAKTLREQSFFYENFCSGVIGTNCSGCNLPCLYELPLLSFVKGRPFPDDFYCMGRMLSPYDCSKLFGGDLFKPDFVTEIIVNPERPTSILNHREESEVWIRGIFNSIS